MTRHLTASYLQGDYAAGVRTFPAPALIGTWANGYPPR